jgi:hypothetical protein
MWIRTCVYLGLLVVVALYVDPSLRYHGSNPMFYRDRDFFQQHMGDVGGPLRYAATLLAQMDYSRWAGATVFCGLIGALAWLTQRLAPRLRTEEIAHLPGALLLVLYVRYEAPVLELAAGLIAVLCLLAGWQRWAPTSGWGRSLVLGGLAALVWVALGTVFGLLFLVLGGLCAWASSREARSALACWGWFVPAAWWLVNDQGKSLTATLTRWAGEAVFVPLVVALLLTPAIILGFAVFLDWREQRFALKQDLRGGRQLAATSKRITPAPRAWATVVSAVLLGVALAGVALGFDPERRALLQIQAGGHRGDWRRVLEAAGRLQDLPPAARLQVNRALFHTGQLTRELFAFPQRAGLPLFGSLADGLELSGPLSETLLELGQVNLAEHYAHEAVEVRGERPELLWHMARINLVKQRPDAAKVFLRRLRQIPFQRARADRLIESLRRDPTAADEPEVASLRSHLVTVDLLERVFPDDVILRQCLQSNPNNRMARDYFLAHLLLSRKLDELMKEISREGSGSAPLPRHLSEAVLAQARSRNVSLDELLPGRWVDADTVDGFRRFLEAGPGQGQSPAARESALAGRFGHTYWFYLSFGRNPGRLGRTGTGGER